ncbi:cytochrome c oxidase assembly protein [Algibacillus agarilyticus]|uniref:cytochrome c oxidase assembly protein n=1 Tax=Algibacillus agarilyticus TaxID=2234133 RepID=UPI000DCFC091|nr:cytochrome c oxidase assembly protein [Algibacillus agarilyticus]
METKPDNKKLIYRLCIAVAFMFGFGFALVPLYDVFCQITGINGRVVVNASEDELQTVDESRLVTVEFITRIANGNNMTFEALTKRVQLHPGQLSEVAFTVKNPSDVQAYAQAIPSVSPGQASLFLNKTECFCFQQQELEANETVTYPMKFYLDRDLPHSISLLTVSYTLYKVGTGAVVSVSQEGKRNVESL